MMKRKYMSYKLQAKPESEAAKLYIFDDIGEYEDDGKIYGFGPKKLVSELDDIEADKIDVHINSMGGYLFEGVAIYNILRTCGKAITCYVDGTASSAASIIAMAGKTVMYPTSSLMIHNCWGLVVGNADDLRSEADRMDKSMESARQAYMQKDRAKFTEEELIEMLNAETVLTAKEAYGLGFCDEIEGEKEEEAELVEPQASMGQPIDKTPEPGKIQPDFEPKAKRQSWFF